MREFDIATYNECHDIKTTIGSLGLCMTQRDILAKHLRQALAKAREDQDRISRAEEREKTIDENTSDGYHTFRELYTFRKMYNAVLFNEWATQGVHDVHKSKKHSDGELCFGGGWFVVYATTPYGQISNHYELADWDLFKCEEREVATKFDGHTPQDVLSTLKALTTQYNNTV